MRGFSEDRTHDLLLTRETLLPLSHEADVIQVLYFNTC